MINWTRENLAWVAGIIEGEGSFSIEYNKRTGATSNRIVVGQKDPEILYKLQEITGMGRITKQQYRDFWVWRVSRRHDVFFLSGAIYEWMSSKRKSEIHKQFQVYSTLENKRNWKL